MSWGLDLDYRGKLPPNHGITKAVTLGNETSMGFYFVSKLDGVAQLRSVSVQPSYKMFACADNFEFNYDTGEPVTYTATSTTTTLNFEVRSGHTYWVILKGYTVGHDIMSIQVDAYSFDGHYVANLRQARNDLYGSNVFGWVGFKNTTDVIPVSFRWSGRAVVYGDTGIGNYIKVTTSYLPLQANGLPSQDISTAWGNTGREFSVTAGTTYYIYLKLAYLSANNGTFVLAWGPSAIQGATVTAQVKDRAGWNDSSRQNQGTATIVSVPNVIASGQYLYCEQQVTWNARNLTRYNPQTQTTGKWVKFIGWWDDESKIGYMNYCLSTNPRFSFPIKTQNYKLYGLVEIQDTDFQWKFKSTSGTITSKATIAKNDPFRITAECWNDLVSYIEQKVNITITNKPFVQVGGRISAAGYNTLKDFCDYYCPTPLPPLQRVSSGDVIQAMYFNNLLSEINQIP